MKRLLPWCTVAVMLASWAGCRTPVPEPLPFTAPPLITEVYYFTGTPLSGPIGAPGDPGKAEDALELKATLFALEQPSKDVFESMASRTRLVAILREKSPLLPASFLTRGARVGAPEDAKAYINRIEQGEFGPSAPVGELSGVLPRGICTAFRIADAAPPDADRLGEPVDRCIEILFHRPPTDGKENEIEVAFYAISLVEPQADAEGPDSEGEIDGAGPDARPPSPDRGTPLLHREILMLDDLATPTRGCLVFFINTLSKVGRARALAAVMEWTPFPAEDRKANARFAEVAAHCREDLKRFEKEASARFPVVPDRPADRPEGSTERSGIESALSALNKPGMHRKALFDLARSTGALFAEDLALSSPDELIAEVAASCLEMAQPEEGWRAADLGFRLEQGAYLLILKRIADQKMTLDLVGKLAYHTGEVGRHPLVLSDILHKAEGIEDLQQRLLYENFLFLNNYDPAARVRAFDWVSARNTKLEGYDPLAPAQERREAIARFLKLKEDPSHGNIVQE